MKVDLLILTLVYLTSYFSFHQYDPEITPENVRYLGPPQVMLAYLKYQWSVGEDLNRREAFVRLQVSRVFLLYNEHLPEL